MANGSELPRVNTGLTAEQVLDAFDRALNDMTDAQVEALVGGEAMSRQAEDTKISSALAEIIDSTGIKNIVSTTSGTGTRYTNITMTVPVGTYVLSFGNITSNDTDATTCQIGVFKSDNSAAAVTVQCERGDNKYVVINVVSTGAYIRVYASDTHSHGADDTVSFSNAMLCKKVYWDISNKYVPPSGS